VATIRLLLDEDVPRSLADTARRRGFDVMHATEVGLSHKPDEVVLAAAVASGRAVMTHNVRHYVPLAHEYARTGRKHRGIVLSNQEPFSELVRRTLLLLATRTHEEIDGTVIWIPR
jgi:predicted nuclease of predicted toxin-antitoxin system